MKGDAWLQSAMKGYEVLWRDMEGYAGLWRAKEGYGLFRAIMQDCVELHRCIFNLCSFFGVFMGVTDFHRLHSFREN